jgi:hypothetical protein
MKAEEAKRLKELEDENRGLRHIVADPSKMLRHITEGHW